MTPHLAPIPLLLLTVGDSEDIAAEDGKESLKTSIISKVWDLMLFGSLRSLKMEIRLNGEQVTMDTGQLTGTRLTLSLDQKKI